MNTLYPERIAKLTRGGFTFVLCVLVSISAFGQIPISDEKLRSLELGKPLERELAGRAQHAYQLQLLTGQFLHIIVDQRGIDAAVALFAPDGKKLVEVDGPEQGPERLYWLAESAGNYRLEVRAVEKDAGAGWYEITLTTLRAATETDRKRLAAETAYATGEKLLDEGKSESARLATRQFEIALPLYRELGDHAQEARALYGLGRAYNSLSEKPAALDHFQQAARLRHDLKDRAGEAAALNNLGVLYTDLGAKRQAVDALTEALKLRREVKDRQGEATTLNSLGVAYRDLGERPKALQHYLLSLQLRRDLNDKAGEAVTLNNLAVLYDDLGEVQKMLDAYAQALPLRRDARGRAITLNNMGRGYDRLGLPDEALNYYRQALPLTRSVPDKLWEARTLNYMGLVHWSLSEYQTALAEFNQALPLYRETKNRAGEAATFNNLGLVYEALKESRAALQAYQQALPLAREVKDHQYEAHIRNNLGFVYDRLGDKSQALEQHQHALGLSREIDDPRRIASAYYGLARVERDNGKLKQARAQIEQAIAIVETLRSKLDSPELRAAYRASTAQYYDFYVDVLMRMNQQQPKSKLSAEALQVNERARARSLIEMLTEAGADIRRGVDPALVKREQLLQVEINGKTAEQLKLLSGQHTPAQSAAATQALEKLAAGLRDTQATIRRSSPQYAALTQPEPLTVAQLQQQTLDPNTVLLEYALGEEHSYLWAVTTTTLHSFTLPNRATIEAAARRYYELLTARNQDQPNETLQNKQTRIANADAESRIAGMALSRMLLGPVAAQLGNKRLVIVGDGVLQYVPFGALPELKGVGIREQGGTATNSSPNPSSLPPAPLILRHEIITLPSASTLAVLRRETRQAAAKMVAVIADPVFNNKDERVKTVAISAGAKLPEADKKASAPAPAATARLLLTKSAQATGGADVDGRIPRLPDTRREAEAILALVNPTSSHAAFDFAANRSAALSDDLGQYRIVHFATHGFLNSTNPALSGLVLSLVDEKGAAQNGFLLAPEIYNLKLSATELVVLSACQTGLGQEVRGEGVIGLTRGFMYAGAPRVVVSLWSVSDQATADLMKSFYTAMLHQGLRPAAALRAAQIALWKQQKWRVPYYWAAFGLQGEWR